MPAEPTVTGADVGNGHVEPGDTSAPTASAPSPAPPPVLREPAATEPVVERRRPAKPPKPAMIPELAPLPVAPAPPTGPATITPLEDLSRHQRKKAARRRARKVKRIVRRVDAWTVLKVSFLFYLCLYVVGMVASVVLWNVAAATGVIDNIESFIEDLGAFETFEFEPGKLLQGAALAGAILAMLATGLTALGAVLFNLISDLVGGIRMTVIEEPPVTPAAPRPSRQGRWERGDDLR